MAVVEMIRGDGSRRVRRTPAYDASAISSLRPVPPDDLEIVTCRVDLVELRRRNVTVGFVELAGRVYVALIGSRYDLAIEVAQSRLFDDCVEAIRRRSL